jgi:hypothetical protein
LSTPRHTAEFIRKSRVRVLMLAGNRESRQPGVADCGLIADDGREVEPAEAA